MNKKYHVALISKLLRPVFIGVILNGGAKPNIIPEETELDYYIRAPSKGELDALTTKCVECFESAAKATGCKVV